jgi:tRNA A-37 threonylcarbamoyl transferase component Bud32
MPLVAGTRLGPYEILGLIGAGGMGEVYKARDTRLDRPVAIKILPTELSADPERRARFEREARTVGALSHPNIVAIHDVGTVETVTYLVMELLEGETLRARLQHSRPAPTPAPGSSADAGAGSGAARPRGGMPIRKALDIAAQVAQGLAAAHAKGIVHRDLKPENIFLTTDGRVKVLDFGLARAVATGMAAAETRTATAPAAVAGTGPGVVLGTVGYMAPEQVRGQAADHRADIFAFGAVLFEMLSGERAFTGGSAIETMSAILNVDPLERREAVMGLPPNLEALVRHCLEKQPEERFESARDLAFQLQALASGSTAFAPPVARRPARWRWVVTASVGAALLVAGAAGGAMFMARRPAPPASPVSFIEPPPAGMSIGNSSLKEPRSVVAVSPDGSRIVFRAGAGARTMLYLRRRDGLTAQPIAGSENAEYPFWSPDGQRIAFCQGGKLKHAAASGGPVQEVATCDRPRTPGSWGPDDSILLVPRYDDPLVLVPANGGPATEVLPRSARNQAYYSPVWLPDGKHFLVVKFFYRQHPADDPGIYVGTLGSKELLPLVTGRVEAVAVSGDKLFFLRDRMLMTQPFDSRSRTLTGQPKVLANGVIAFSAGSGTVAYYDPADGFSLGHRVAWFLRDGTLASYSGPPGSYRDPRISPNQLSLATSQLDAEGLPRVWVYDIARGSGLPLTAAPSVAPTWSPDGTSVIVWDGNPDAKRWSLNGVPSGDPFAGLSGERPRSCYDWSPDGSWLLASIGGGLEAVPLGGAGKLVPVAVSPFAGATGDFSPDGRWVAFDSAASGSQRVYVTPFPGPGERQPVASFDGVNARWRKDGRELFFLGLPDRLLYSVPVTPQGSRLDLGQPHALFNLPALKFNWYYDVTDDGQRFVAVVEGEPDPTPLKVFVNPR